MLAVFGEVVFEVSSEKVLTWLEARRSGTARWHEHEVHLAKPRPEFLGPPLDVVTLPIRLDLSLGVVPRDELRRMRQMRDTGAVERFLVGDEPVGDFRLTSLSETWRHLDANGVLTVAQAEVTLAEYA